MRTRLALSLVCLLAAGLTGCRCGNSMNRCGDLVDDLNDTQILFDSWYCPRWDISRAGRPDWCGPINRALCPCRCEQGTYGRADECWQYPPSYPYLYPGNSLQHGTTGTAPAQPAAPAPPAYEEPAPPSAAQPKTAPPFPVAPPPPE